MLSRVLQRSSGTVRRPFSSLVPATEEFHAAIKTNPKKASPAVIEQSKLATGVRVITRDHSASTVTMKFVVTGGSSSETVSEQGFSHFLSSTGFVGTAHRSGLRLIRDLENVGAVVEASADREKITFSASCLADKVEETFGAVAEALSSPVGANKFYQIGESREVAKVDIAAHQADSSAQLDELLHEAAYGENSPMGAPVHANDVTKLDVHEVMAYRARNFTAGNLIVSATGVSHDTIKSLTECHFNGMPTGASKAGDTKYHGGDMKVRVDLGGTSRVGLAFPVPAGAAAQPFKVLYSKLAAKAGEMKGVTPFMKVYSHGGIFGVHTSGDAAVGTENLKAIVAELKAIAGGVEVTEGEKNQITLNNLLQLENGDAANVLVNAVMTGVPAEVAADVRGVSGADVASAAKAALAATPSYAVYGATAGTPSFSTVAAMMK